MSLQDPHRSLRDVYDAYRTRAFEAASAHFIREARLTIVPTGDVYEGREGFVRYARAWAAAFPDLRIEVERLDASHTGGVVEYSLKGTHTGALLSGGGFVPPTWSSVEVRICDVLRFEGGEISRLDSFFDSGTLLRQMGLLPHSPLHSADRRAALQLYATTVDASADQRNKAIVHRFLEEVVNQRNPAAAAAVCAADVAWHGATMGEARDLGGLQSLLAAFFAAFPDLEVEVHDTLAEESRVSTRLTLRGTHLGEFHGVDPTGRRVTSPAQLTCRIAGGHIAEEWWQSDLLGVLRQLDALPAARSA